MWEHRKLKDRTLYGRHEVQKYKQKSTKSQKNAKNKSIHNLELGLWEHRKLRRQNSPWQARGTNCHN